MEEHIFIMNLILCINKAYDDDDDDDDDDHESPY